MSNALALSAVTATLQYWLSSTLNDPSASLGSVAVTAVSPDIAQPGGPTGANAELSVTPGLRICATPASMPEPSPR